MRHEAARRRRSRQLALACLSGAMQALAAQPLMPALSAPTPSAPAAPVLTPPVQANYMLNCMGCHLADGSGAPGKVPSLRDSLVPLAMSAAGRRYLVQVPGVSRSLLTDRELAQLLGWMVRNLSARPVPAGFADFTSTEVAGYRKTPLVNVRRTRARLLPAAASQATR